MVNEEQELQQPVRLERLHELLAALAEARPARMIIRTPSAVAELTCCLGDFTSKGAWLNYECDQFHAHVNLAEIRSVALVEKATQRSVQCFDANGAVVFKYFLKDNAGAYDRLKREFA